MRWGSLQSALRFLGRHWLFFLPLCAAGAVCLAAGVVHRRAAPTVRARIAAHVEELKRHGEPVRTHDLYKLCPARYHASDLAILAGDTDERRVNLDKLLPAIGEYRRNCVCSAPPEYYGRTAADRTAERLQGPLLAAFSSAGETERAATLLLAWEAVLDKNTRWCASWLPNRGPRWNNPSWNAHAATLAAALTPPLGAKARDRVQELIESLLDGRTLVEQFHRRCVLERALLIDLAAKEDRAVLLDELHRKLLSVAKADTALAGALENPAATMPCPMLSAWPAVAWVGEPLAHDLDGCIVRHLLAKRRLLAIRLAAALAAADGVRIPTIDDLVPRYLPAIPPDPFAPDLGPLVSYPTAQGLLVYSIGPNGRDQGGVGGYPADTDITAMPGTDDIWITIAPKGATSSPAANRR